MATRELYRFGAFTLDVADRRLSRGDTPMHVSPKAYDVLVVLVRHAGRLVTKDDLLARVWPEAFVEEGILTVHISSLRKALGDLSDNPAYIQTIPRSGYRFVASVATEDDRNGGTSREPSRPLEAYEQVGRGRAHLLSASFFELPHAVSAFQAAIALDPTYAAAHAGLALARCGQAILRAVPHSEAYAEAKASALRALAMDDACADAQVALGVVLFFSEWDWTGAERSFQRALAINPNHTEAYLYYGGLMEALGRLDRGFQLKQQALERDPASPFVLISIAVSFWNQRRYDETITWTQKALEQDRQHPMARELLAGAYGMKGEFERMVAVDVSVSESIGAPAETIEAVKRTGAAIQHAHEKERHAEAMRDILKHRSAAERGRAGLNLPPLYAEAGDLDAAFEHLHRALDSRDPALVHLAVAPQWDRLRGDPRFNQCLARMGLGPAAPCGRDTLRKS